MSKEQILKELQQFGITTPEQLQQELKESHIDIGFFVSPRKEV